MFGFFHHRRKRKQQPELDAVDMIASFGDQAYFEARWRAEAEDHGREITPDRQKGHWWRVSSEIARKTGRRAGMDTATRYLESD